MKIDFHGWATNDAETTSSRRGKSARARRPSAKKTRNFASTWPTTNTGDSCAPNITRAGEPGEPGERGDPDAHRLAADLGGGVALHRCRRTLTASLRDLRAGAELHVAADRHRLARLRAGLEDHAAEHRHRVADLGARLDLDGPADRDDVARRLPRPHDHVAVDHLVVRAAGRRARRAASPARRRGWPARRGGVASAAMRWAPRERSAAEPGRGAAPSRSTPRARRRGRSGRAPPAARPRPARS